MNVVRAGMFVGEGVKAVRAGALAAMSEDEAIDRSETVVAVESTTHAADPAVALVDVQPALVELVVTLFDFDAAFIDADLTLIEVDCAGLLLFLPGPLIFRSGTGTLLFPQSFASRARSPALCILDELHC